MCTDLLYTDMMGLQIHRWFVFWGKIIDNKQPDANTCPKSRLQAKVEDNDKVLVNVKDNLNPKKK